MKKIENVKEYAERLRKRVPTLYAKKTGDVTARIGKEGEEIATYVSDGTLETVNRVKRDENGALGVVVSTADGARGIVVDANGRTNTYIIDRKTFDRKYKDADRVSEERQLFQPKGEIQAFVQTEEDISITAPWGEEENLKAGSFLNVTDPNGIYGVAYEEFLQTYSLVGRTEPDVAPPNDT